MDRQIWNPAKGEISRTSYVLLGIALFALKHNLDRLVASLAFHRRFTVFNYWISPVQVLHITTLPRKDLEFLLTMLAMALPFIAVGVVLTVRRLRSIGLPLWLAVLFFLPILNIAFFLILGVLPSQDGPTKISPPNRTNRFLDRMIPDSAWGSAAIATLVAGPMCAA